MPPSTETETQELRDLVVSLREEMRLGFSEVKCEIKSEIQRVEAKTDAKLAEIKAEIQSVEAKTDAKLAEIKASIDIKTMELSGKIDVIDERTKLGFWGFIGRSVLISILGLLVIFALKFILFGTVKGI